MSLPPLPKGMGNLGGVFDLGTLKQPAVTIDPADLGYVVTQNNLISELLPASHEAVVILICWSPRSTQAQSLLPMMSQFIREDAARTGETTWIYGTVNVDTEPAVAKALQVQSVPLAIAIIQEQLVPLFESIPPKEQVRAVINKVLELAAQKGIGAHPNSEMQGSEGTDPIEAIEPEEEEALKALQSGDYLLAKAAYEKWLKRTPSNEFAKLGLAQVELMARIEGLDPVETCKLADANSNDLPLQMQAADCEVAQGDIERAFYRLIEVIKRTSGDERKSAREHLLLLFSLVDPVDPILIKARSSLASALF
jgi:putative thioredoxin